MTRMNGPPFWLSLWLFKLLDSISDKTITAAMDKSVMNITLISEFGWVAAYRLPPCYTLTSMLMMNVEMKARPIMTVPD